MAGPIIPEESPAASEASASTSNRTQLVKEALKRADQYIRKGDLNRAQEELKIANQLAKDQFRKPIASPPDKEKFVLPQPPPQPLPPSPIEAMMASIVLPKNENNLPARNNQSVKANPEKPFMPQSEKGRELELKSYREALVRAWHDGAPPSDTERQLQDLRSVLGISDSEHRALEKEIRVKCFREAITNFISDNALPAANIKMLAELQKCFRISEEEYPLIKSFVRSVKQPAYHDKIFIIDDDVQLLGILATSMSEDGFDVAAVPTSDEAYTLLQKYTPDIILCDINLATSSMDGFTFFEKIQKDRRLQQIPFIFLTGLMSEKLIFTGKELGADDYLVKPISKQMLISAIRGRLKRFRQLRGLS
jgi:CheY-like chemotaxis protein